MDKEQWESNDGEWWSGRGNFAQKWVQHYIEMKSMSSTGGGGGVTWG